MSKDIQGIERVFYLPEIQVKEGWIPSSEIPNQNGLHVPEGSKQIYHNVVEKKKQLFLLIYILLSARNGILGQSWSVFSINLKRRILNCQYHKICGKDLIMRGAVFNSCYYHPSEAMGSIQSYCLIYVSLACMYINCFLCHYPTIFMGEGYIHVPPPAPPYLCKYTRRYLPRYRYDIENNDGGCDHYDIIYLRWDIIELCNESMFNPIHKVLRWYCSKEVRCNDIQVFWSGKQKVLQSMWIQF